MKAWEKVKQFITLVFGLVTITLLQIVQMFFIACIVFAAFYVMFMLFVALWN